MKIWCLVLMLLGLLASAEAGECPEEFVKFGDFCYSYFTEKKIWFDAEGNCSQITTYDGTPGHLVSIHNQEENEFVTNMTGPNYPDTWTGLLEIEDGHVFVWTDDTPVDYNAWYPGEPNNAGIACGEINHSAHDPGTWNDQGCDNALNAFICKIPVDTTFWTTFVGSTYRFFSDMVTWDDANDICQSHSGHLVIIDSDAENEFISTLTAASTTACGPPTWIGLKLKHTPSIYVLSNGADYTGTYHQLSCVSTNYRYNRGEWNNDDCLHKLAFVCEKE